MKPNTETKIIVLGGLGEVGKNMYCLMHEDEIVIIGPIKIDYYTSLGSYFYTYAVDKNRTLQSPSCYQYSDTEAGIEINYSSVEDRDFWTDFNDKDHNALFVKGTVIINSETYKLHINATEIKFAK